MPRPRSDTGAGLADLQKRLKSLVETARKEGRADALAEVRSLVGGAVAKRGPGRPRKVTKAKRKKKRKNPWANLTPKERLKRINAMRRGRGLPLKRKL